MKNWKEMTQNLKTGGVAPTQRTLIEILGRGRVLVEHHRGIVGYSQESILVGTTYGSLRVDGRDLRLCCMSREQLVIAGAVEEIVLEGREP